MLQVKLALYFWKNPVKKNWFEIDFDVFSGAQDNPKNKTTVCKRSLKIKQLDPAIDQENLSE